MKKISLGIIVGAMLGIFISSYFVNDYSFEKIIYTKITLSALLTGLFSGGYANFHPKPFNLFIGCLFIGAVIFYVKFLITGHNFDPINMGTFTGALLGFLFYAIEKKAVRKRPNY
jgi:hypothetical protein